MSKFLIIDGNAILHRAYHAIPDLTNKQGEHTNAVYGFVSMLLRLVSDLKPTHLAVCFDEKEKTFRKKDFEAYQAKRPKMDPWLSSQVEIARDFLDAAKIPWYSKGGYEADDVIGTICSKTTDLKLSITVDELIIVTGDRDLFQLINDKVKILVPTKGMSQGKLYDTEEVKKDYDFAPVQMIDYKALVGDSSDNYPGVSGIGPKTARELIIEYKTIENIYNHLDKISEKVRQKLINGKKDAFFFHKIATIFKEVPINFKLEETKNWNLGGEESIGFIQNLGFKSILKRLPQKQNESDKIKQEVLF